MAHVQMQRQSTVISFADRPMPLLPDLTNPSASSSKDLKESKATEVVTAPQSKSISTSSTIHVQNKHSIVSVGDPQSSPPLKDAALPTSNPSLVGALALAYIVSICFYQLFCCGCTAFIVAREEYFDHLHYFNTYSHK